jgi:hypothetical protein
MGRAHRKAARAPLTRLRRIGTGGYIPVMPGGLPMTVAPQDDPRTLVSTDWLARHLRDPDLRLLDASWYLPAQGRDAKAEYDAAHIPSARFFDIDEISDQRSDLPHMAPPPEKFISRIRWWSMTARGSSARRGSGGPSG